MLKTRMKRLAADQQRSLDRLAAIEAAVATLGNEDLLDLADIFAGAKRHRCTRWRRPKWAAAISGYSGACRVMGPSIPRRPLRSGSSASDARGRADTNFASNVVVDRELITGQNPASDRALADTLLEALGRTA
ncbi:hypothetical protein P0F65_17810 [Sphingomonas sp. I4]